ncbi:MAG: PhoU domain-containing protein [Bacteroidota bacterium]|nr:PhoU domain-containing protein [Bacteroidota bacterium]
MINKKEKAITHILADFEEFANLILQQLDILEKFINSDEIKISDKIYQEIVENEKKFDLFEVEISERIIKTIILYHPLASDLRKIMTCYRISLNLERIGDKIMNIVNFIKSINEPSLYLDLKDVISQMLSYSIKMVSKSLISFINSDKDFAIWTIKNDEVVDELNKKSLTKVIRKGKMTKETQQLLFNFLNTKEIISNIERIADQATNIAEASFYAIEGKDIRHKEINDINSH